MLVENRYPSQLKNIRQICQVVSDMAKVAVDKKIAYEQKLHFLQQIELMTGEACTNSICHNPIPGSGEVLLKMRYHHRFIDITVMDQNPEFDFYNIRKPKFDDIPEGGYGLHIIKTIADKVIYKREDGWNMLLMIKRINHQ